MVVTKKRKLSKKGIFIIVIVVVLCILILVPIVFNYITNQQLTEIGYSKSAIVTIRKNNLKDYLIEKGKNETLDKVLSSKDFKLNNLTIYEEIALKDYDNFTSHINRLIDKGYSSDEINQILTTGTDSEIASFLETDYIANVSKYLQYDYAKLSNFDRYVSYQKEKLVSDQETVVMVNIGLDQPFYDNAHVITDFSLDVLANKYRQLGEAYVPEDLVSIPEKYCLNKGQQLVRVAYDEFVKMVEDAKAEDYTIKIRSSYRTYQDQDDLYQIYKEKYGQTKADGIAARAGFSEHQTGLVVDVGTSDESVFSTTDEFKWLTKNAHKYGFILRYPKGKEAITGYNYEAWHYRYVGEEIATYIVENNITFDEYYVMFLDK